MGNHTNHTPTQGLDIHSLQVVCTERKPRCHICSLNSAGICNFKEVRDIEDIAGRAGLAGLAGQGQGSGVGVSTPGHPGAPGPGPGTPVVGTPVPGKPQVRRAMATTITPSRSVAAAGVAAAAPAAMLATPKPALATPKPTIMAYQALEVGPDFLEQVTNVPWPQVGTWPTHYTHSTFHM